jgi:CBS domain-containing protein
MTTVSQLLARKGNRIFAVGPDDAVYAAIRMMADENVGSVLVMDGNRVVGIVTERLYARNVALKGRTSATTRVGEIMETRVIYARPDQTVEECLAVMITKRLRHLPVIDQGRVLGMISIGDLGRSIVGDQKIAIDQLVHYIHGEPA